MCSTRFPTILRTFCSSMLWAGVGSRQLCSGIPEFPLPWLAPLHGKRKWHLSGQRTTVRKPRARRTSVRASTRRCRHNAARHCAVAQSRCVLLRRQSKNGSLHRRRFSSQPPLWRFAAERLARPRIYLFRTRREQADSLARAHHAPDRGAVLRLDESPELRTTEPNFGLPNNQAGIPGNPSTQTGFCAISGTTSPPTGLLGVGQDGDSSPRMIEF